MIDSPPRSLTSIESVRAPAAPSALGIATSAVVVKLALRTAVVVGSLLNVINQGGALLGEAHLDVLKLVLTYCVPYCVATYSATSITLKRRS